MRHFFDSFRKPSLAALLGAAMGLLAMGDAARAANPLELNFWLSGPRYDGQMAQCEQALYAISVQFQEKESKFWNSGLAITGFADVHEVAYRPWSGPNSAYNSIPRRFCSANAMLNDGVPRQVHYSIIEDGGFAGSGLTSGLEWCVVGLDRNWAYSPACRSAKP
ncbi:MAG: hypothetical protein EKK40_17805 [Bradyrhizobiaceae bacterium]|nr:MAG: hypothetical protein EKK40_17805 [Bradyrhizobiaceae bacterium]